MLSSWGLILQGLDSESRGGAHCVAPEAASELNAQAEAKFHKYYFILR
jgi:hypothetical protein